MDGSDGAILRKWLGGDVSRRKRWGGCRLVRSIRDRENKELAPRMVTCSQVKKSRILGELRDVERLSRKTIKIPDPTASSSTDRSQGCVSVYRIDFFRSYMTTLALCRTVTFRVGGRADFNHQPVGFITIFVEFCPGHLVSIPTEYRVMRRALRA